jgi:hypothetical protein
MKTLLSSLQYRGGGGVSLPPPVPPPAVPTVGSASRNARNQGYRKPRGFLSTVLSSGDSTDNSANMKTLLGG